MADDQVQSPNDKKGDAKLLEEARKRFKRAMEADDEQRKLRIADMRFHAGNSDNHYQWSEDAIRSRAPNGKLNRPMLTVNRLPQHTRQVTNEQRQNRPSIKVRAVDEKGDVKVAEVLNGVVRHVENNKNERYSGASVAYTTACEHQVIAGLGYFAIQTDYCDDESFDQDIFFRRIRNPNTIYEDPDIQTPEGRDRRFLFETDLVTEDEFERRFPDADKTEWTALSAEEYAHWYQVTEKMIRIANYWRVEESIEWLSQDADGNITRGPKKIEGAVASRKVRARKVMCYTINGTEVLERYEWPGRFIPFCRVVGNEYDIDGKVEVSGLVRNAKGAQQMYNWWQTSNAEMLGSATKSPWLTSKEAVKGHEDKWAAANQQNYAYLTYNQFDEDDRPLEKPERVAPAVPSAGYMQAMLTAADDIKATTGQYDASLGQRSNETSGRAIANRQRESDTANFHYMDNLAVAIEFAGQIIVEIAPKIYDTARVVRIIGEDGTEDYAQINPEIQRAVEQIQGGKEQYNLGVGKYDVVVTVGPSYATKRQEAAELAVQLTQANPAFGAATMDLMPKMLDMPYADEFQKRLRAMLPPQIQQAIGTEDEGEPLPPQVMMMMNQAKEAIGQAHGQLEAANAALQEKERELQALQAKASAADSATAMVKAEADIARAEADKFIAEKRVEEAALSVELAEAKATAAVAALAAERDRKAAEMDAEETQRRQDERAAILAPLNQLIEALQQSQTEMGGALAALHQQQQALAQSVVNKPGRVRIKAPSGRMYDAVRGEDGSVAVSPAAV